MVDFPLVVVALDLALKDVCLVLEVFLVKDVLLVLDVSLVHRDLPHLLDVPPMLKDVSLVALVPKDVVDGPPVLEGVPLDVSLMLEDCPFVLHGEWRHWESKGDFQTVGDFRTKSWPLLSNSSFVKQQCRV